MARSIGPDDRTVYLTNGLAKAAGLSAVVYADAAATTLADILTEGGAAISGSTLTVDDYSQLPLFQFPDGADTVYVRVNGGPATALYARADDRLDQLTTLARSLSPAAGVMAALDRGQTTVIQLAGGDSTSNEVTEWFALLGEKIGAANPTYNVKHMLWNASTQTYDPPTTLQAGPSGDSKVTLTSGILQHSGTATTGDLDIRLKLRPVSWASGGLQVAACKWLATGNQRSWWFGLTSGGLLCLTWTTDGTSGTQQQKFSTAAVGFAANTTKWVRVTLTLSTGVPTFYSSDDGVTWTQVGGAVTGVGATSVHPGTAPYQLGGLDNPWGSVYNGDVFWAEVRSGVAGPSAVPPLPDTWDQISAAYVSNTVLLGGSPTLLMVAGSEGGQNLAYWDDATRRPRMLAAFAPHLIVVNSNHNELYVRQQWISQVNTYLTNVKAAIPGVPIVMPTQNPSTSPNVQNLIEYRARRSPTLAAWARSQSGVYVVDTWTAFDDLAVQLISDGTHPTTDANGDGNGSQVWADEFFRVLFPGV